MLSTNHQAMKNVADSIKDDAQIVLDYALRVLEAVAGMMDSPSKAAHLRRCTETIEISELLDAIATFPEDHYAAANLLAGWTRDKAQEAWDER